jgi:hypothetical protein
MARSHAWLRGILGRLASYVASFDSVDEVASSCCGGFDAGSVVLLDGYGWCGWRARLVVEVGFEVVAAAEAGEEEADWSFDAWLVEDVACFSVDAVRVLVDRVEDLGDLVEGEAACEGLADGVVEAGHAFLLVRPSGRGVCVHAVGRTGL